MLLSAELTERIGDTLAAAVQQIVPDLEGEPKILANAITKLEEAHGGRAVTVTARPTVPAKARSACSEKS